jgi:hypothetical protein
MPARSASARLLPRASEANQRSGECVSSSESGRRGDRRRRGALQAIARRGDRAVHAHSHARRVEHTRELERHLRGGKSGEPVRLVDVGDEDAGALVRRPKLWQVEPAKPMYRCDYSMVVTNRYFTEQALRLAKARRPTLESQRPCPGSPREW